MLPIFLAIENDSERELAEQLFLTYKSKMYNIAYSILHNNEDAEDSIMDAIYKIANNISMFVGIDRNKTESLIVIIIRNTAINRYHYNQHRVHTPIEELDNVLYDETPSPMDLVIEAEQYEELLNKIRSLEPIYRDVILLKYLYDYDNGTIASLTGVAEATVRVRLMRARQLLDELLKGGKADE